MCFVKRSVARPLDWQTGGESVSILWWHTMYARVLERRINLTVDSVGPVGDLETVDKLFTFAQLCEVTREYT